MTHLDQLPNSFEAINRVQCFNHTMQLSAKALLKPFSNSPKDDDTTECGNDDKDAGVEPINEGSDDEDGEGGDDQTDDYDYDNDNDPFEMLDEADREQLLENTAAVHATLNKVCIVTLCSNC
jgi:hypothetical protein